MSVVAGPDRLLSRALIGREDELNQLSHAARDVAQNAGRCVLIAGEAGIGKTRLVAELRARFEGLALQGQCYEEDASFAFAPLQTGLRSLLHRADEPTIALFARRADGLAPLLPELAERSGLRADTGEGDPAASQRALFEAVTALLFDLAAGQPLLVVFEDLHWSDESTLSFIRFIARRLASRAVLLIGTYRPGSLAAPLPDLIFRLEREHLTEQLTLPPLNRSQVDALLRSLFDSTQPISSDFLDTVATFSEGNPLYVEELVRAMIQAGDVYRADGVWARKAVTELRVPGSVQDAVRRSSAGLTDEARRVLALAAVAGREFDFEVLAQVAGLREADLVASLKELIETGFIMEERADSFSFRHALIREAAQGLLLARERRAAHARFAGALKRLHQADPDAYAAELAYHYYEAGAWAQALPHAQRAGEQARRLDATREALSQFTRAVDCARHLGDETPVDLLLARAELYERAGEFERADADLAAVLAGTEQAGSQHEMWLALVRLGYLWAARDYARSLEWFERGLAVADALADPLARAETLNRIGNVYLNRDQPEEALPYHEKALAEFESVGDLVGQANTLELMGVCYYNLPDVLAGAACEERALALGRSAAARAEHEQAAAGRSVVFHASIHLLLPLRFDTEVGPPVDARRLVDLGEEALKLARAMSWPAGEAQALGLLGGFLGLLGDHGQSLAYLRNSLQLAEQLEHVAGIAAAERMIAAVLLELLEFDEAADRLRRAWTSASAAGAHLFGDIAALALAPALVNRGRREDLMEAGQLLDGLPEGNRLPGGRMRREAMAVRAEFELARGNVEAALAAVEPLIANTCHLLERGLAAIPRLALLLGRILAATGRNREAKDALQAAVAGAQEQGRRPLLWRAHAALGRLYFSSKQRRLAQDHFGQARAVINELVAMVPDAPLRENFAAKALAAIPSPRAPTVRRIETQAHHGLTERERAVAALVAAGRSNREIGETLVISERTAERHVANILDKLGLASRVQLATWVAENLHGN
ncbi:MAG: helix-turn-helix transcriptional regulator [Nitrososphaerales archaeon]